MRWVGFVLAALWLFVASAAHAQSIPSPPAGKPSAADEATAKKDFASGLKLYGEGAYAEALVAFEQSYRLGGRPSALKNIAQCHRNLKHFVEAYEGYDQMLTAHASEISAADKTAVQQALDELSVLTGTLQVTTSEPDADVEIDGKSFGKGSMARPKRVTVAAHQVRVTKTGFSPFETTVNVGSQEAKKVDAKLEVENLAAHVSVREQSGREVNVFVDGKDKGPAPWEGEIPQGDHTIEAKSTRFASEAQKIHLGPKERLDVALNAAPLTGHLRVTTIPAGAAISVDGKAVGTGAWEGELPEGPHHVEVTLEGQPPQVRDVTLGRGQLIVQEIPIAVALGERVTEYKGIYVRPALFAGFGLGGAGNNATHPTGDPNAGGSPGIIHDGSFFIDFAFSLRAGWAFLDWLAGEVVFIGAFEPREENFHVSLPSSSGGSTNTPSFSDQHFALRSNGPSFFIGTGPRVTSKGETVRFTFGIAPGVSIRSFNPKLDTTDNNNGGNNPGSSCQVPPCNSSGNRFAQTTTGQTSGPTQTSFNGEDFGGAGYTAFSFVMEGGVLIGSTPGSKFFLGIEAWIDLPPSDIATGPETQTAIPNASFPRAGRGFNLTDGAQFFFGPTIGVQFGH